MCSCGGSVVLAFYLLLLQTVYAQTGKSCTTPNGEQATCKSIYDCKILLDAVQTRNSGQLNFLRESQCGFIRNPLVCCGTQDNYAPSTPKISNRTKQVVDRSGEPQSNSAIPDRTTCGFQSSDRIFGGEETSMDEFPWMALLEYVTSSNKKKFSCGGALISKRYILTAAHCVTGDILTKVGQLVNVRLGEWDITQDVDCIKELGIKICNKAPEDFEPKDILIHPDYDFTSAHRYGDIALIQLNRDVTYSEFIRPICLPLSNESSRVGDKLYVAGWGKTEYENQNSVKLKLEVPITDKSECKRTFRSAGVNVKDIQICAGGEKGKDSCTGDSGGPLMRTIKNDSSRWYIEGIVSFGAKCGTEKWPGIYTKVSKYLDWIYENVDK